MALAVWKDSMRFFPASISSDSRTASEEHLNLASVLVDPVCLPGQVAAGGLLISILVDARDFALVRGRGDSREQASQRTWHQCAHAHPGPISSSMTIPS
jgi:hypothetical protein